MVPLRVKDKTIPFGPGVVAEIAPVVFDLVVHGLDMLPQMPFVVGPEIALVAFEPFDPEVDLLDVKVDV